MTTPEAMFGKIMSIPDKAMSSYARLVTRWGIEKINEFEKQIAAGEVHPKDAKMALAQEITAAFFDEENAKQAKQRFINVFQKGDMPDEIPEYHHEGEQILLDILVGSGMVESKSQARRLIDQNGVKVNGETVSDPYLKVNLHDIVQVGKRRYFEST